MRKGAKITNIREMTEDELKDQGWFRNPHKSAVAIEFDNGDTLYPSCDDEGNDYGALFGRDKNGNSFTLSIPKPALEKKVT